MPDRTALHEALHAAAGLAAGLPVRWAAVRPKAEVHFVADLRKSCHVDAYVLAALLPSLTMRTLFESAAPAESFRNDRALASWALGLRGRASPRRRALLEARAKALARRADFRRAVEDLAEALSHAGFLPGVSVERLVRARLRGA